MRRVLLIGATSAIVEATAKRFARQGDNLYLLGRSAPKLQAIASNLKVLGANHVCTGIVDANDYAMHASAVEKAIAALGGIDVALLGYGVLPDQKACQDSADAARQALEINATSLMSLMTDLANIFEKQGGGTLAVISSVAGDRGRQSNYIYGAAKAGLNVFAQGLRNRLDRAGVNVLVIKPGFVDTPMTAEFAAKGLLWATPERVASDIYKAIVQGRHTVYTPWFWRWIMLGIRCIPEVLFKRLSL